MKYLLILFAFSPLSSFAATCAAVPVLEGAAATVLRTERVEILRGATGSIQVREGGTCTFVYFADARLGEKEARALGCASWLNYDLPTFREEGYNVAAQLTAGKGGTWSRRIRYDRGRFLLETTTGSYDEDPALNTFRAGEPRAIDCTLD